MFKINYCILIFMILLTSSGQSQVALVSQTTKLLKTQGSNKFQSVTCGMQDKKGIIWFGTSGEGIYKYDGKYFTQFTKNNGLISNNVWSILEDKNGIIWIGTSEGICRFDGNIIITVSIPNHIRPIYKSNNFDSDWSNKNTVWSMLQDKKGTIWFGTGDGVYCYDGANFTHFLKNENFYSNDNLFQSEKVINKDSLHLRLVSKMLEDKNGNIWFASGMPPGYEGISRFDGKMIENFKPKNEGWFRNIIESKNGKLLLATRHFGVWSYDGKSFSDYNQPKDLLNGSLNDILEDKLGNLWVASDYGKDLGDTLGGLWRSNPASGKSNEIQFTKISNKEVFFIFEDKKSNIWFGTRGMGLYRYDGITTIQFSE